MSRETKQPELSDGQLALYRWRYKEARRAGMSIRDSKLFAGSRIDIEEMRRVARAGYPIDELLSFLL